MNKPIEITLGEWEEIMQVREVWESWGLNEETAEEFAGMVYGVKFGFVSGCPGFVGDLYILQGDMLTGHPPMVIKRQDGLLRMA